MITAKAAIKGLTGYGFSLVHLERVLHIPFGTLSDILERKRVAEPETVTLMNILYNFPGMVDEANNSYKENTIYHPPDGVSPMCWSCIKWRHRNSCPPENKMELEMSKGETCASHVSYAREQRL